MKLNVKEITLFGLLGALMYASKVAMQFLPNVHLIGTFIVATTLVFRKKALYPLYIYIFCEGLFGGFAASRIIKCDASQTAEKTTEQNIDESGLPDNISESTILETHSDLSETANSSETTQSTQIEKETEFKDELAEFSILQSMGRINR